MSSSMRNAIQRRSHRERAQPKERKRFGLLEKHKDYSLRAKDWNKKKAVLQSLRQKAADRNEDEFSYKMLSRKGPGNALSRGSDSQRHRKWTGTVDGDRGNRSLSVDTVRLLKTQDANYIRTMRNVLAKEVQQLEERTAVAKSFIKEQIKDFGDYDDEDEDSYDATPKRKGQPPKKIVFAESAAEREEVMDDEEDDDEDDQDSEDGDGGNGSSKSRPKIAKKIETAARLQRRLTKARRRLKSISDAENELDLQRARMAKTATVDMVTKSGRRIKVRERKR